MKTAEPGWVAQLEAMGCQVTYAAPDMLPGGRDLVQIWSPNPALLRDDPDYAERVKRFVWRHLRAGDVPAARVVSDGQLRYLVTRSYFDPAGDWSRVQGRTVYATHAIPLNESEPLP